MKLRFNAYKKTTDDFINDILVECPACCKKAIVKTSSQNKVEQETKVTCTGCGYNKFLLEKPKDRVTFSNGKTWDLRFLNLNSNVDPYFGLNLWLQKEFNDGIFWAYSYDHLRFLKGHISADLRERDLDNILNRSIGSRLPKWLSLGKNRENLIKVIKALKEK